MNIYNNNIIYIYGNNCKLNNFEMYDTRINNNKWILTNIHNHPIDVDFRCGMAVSL